MMELESSTRFRCDDCYKVFSRRMDYNRHRKSHDRPYPCSFCKKAFGLRADRERHKLVHGGFEPKIKCNFDGCEFRGTNRKDYLWKHMTKKHPHENNPLLIENPLRKRYLETIKEVMPAMNDNEKCLQILEQLVEAAKRGDESTVRIIFQGLNTSEAKIRFQGHTALHLAAREGLEMLARVFLETGGDVHRRSNSGETAIFMAVKAGHAAMVQLLLENGASAWEKSLCPYYDMSPLSTAAQCGHLEVVKILIEYESIPEQIDIWSDVLGYAIRHNHVTIVALLLENGADINHRGRWWEPHLHAATIAGPGFTKLVLKAKPNLEIEDWCGRSPLHSHLKSRSINTEVVSLLIEAGANISPEFWRYFTPELQEKYADRCPI